MTLLLDGQPVRTWVLEAGRDEWATRTYVATARTTFGHPMLTLRLADLADSDDEDIADAVHEALAMAEGPSGEDENDERDDDDDPRR